MLIAPDEAWADDVQDEIYAQNGDRNIGYYN